MMRVGEYCGEELFMIIGNKHWAMTNGWISPLSDETVSLLNISQKEAHVQIMLYYSNRNPVGPYRYTVPAGRLRRVCFNSFKDPEPIPRTTAYASTIESDVPIVVQRAGFDAVQSFRDSSDNKES